MIKILILVSLFGMSGLLGFESAKVYSKKIRFFEDIVDFTKNIKTEISFLKTDMISLFSKYNYKSNLHSINEQIMSFQKNGEVLSYEKIKNIVSNSISLDEEKINVISKMYYELGTLGYVEQLERLEYYINQFEAMKSASIDRANKMIPFCKKMGFLIGSLVCIILI